MINCKVTSLTETMDYNDLQTATLPALSGQIQILPDHAESFILLKKGDVVFKRAEGKKETLQIPGGSCHIKDNILTIIL